MKKNSRVLFVISLAISLCFSGCTKKQTQDIDNETQSSLDNAIADQEFTAIVPAIVQNAWRVATGCEANHRISGDTLFGTAGHADPTDTLTVSDCALHMPDGKVRSGKLFAHFTGKLRDKDAKLIVKLINYKASGITYVCDSMVITTVSSAAGASIYHVSLMNGQCKTTSFNIRYSSERTVTLVTSEAVQYVSVFGTSTGTNRTNRAFTVNIPETSPLIKHADCEFIDRGSLSLTPDGYNTRTVDFGAGTCDADATFSVKGNTLAFKLK